MNENADNGVKVSCTKLLIPSSSSSSIPANVPNVATTTSLAANPAMIATAACHVPNPNGAKIGAINEPIIPNTLSAEPYSTPNGNMLKAHKTIEQARMMVPAFHKNPFTFSQVCNNTPFMDGTLYVGNSITNGVDNPLNIVLLRIAATINATTIPNT